MYQAIFFDLDDTIFSYALCGRNALEKTFQICAFPYSDQAYALFHQIDEELWGQQKAGLLTIEEVLTARAEQMTGHYHSPEKRTLFQETFVQKLAEEVEMEPFAQQVLVQLSGKVALYAASNGFLEVQRARLKKAGLLACFTDLFVSDALGVEKPDRRFFTACLARCRLSSREVLMVGDSLQADMAGAGRAGLDCCWYNPQKLPQSIGYPVTYQITDLRQIQKFLFGQKEKP